MIKVKPYSYARKKIIECDVNTSVKTLAGIFEDENVGSALVKDGKGEHVGMITDSIIFRAIADGVNVRELSIKDFKLMPLVKVGKNAGFDEVMELFKKHPVNRIAMVDDKDKIVAVVKEKNLERASLFTTTSKILSLRK